MATEVVMPALGMAQETGKLIRWLKEDGEQVAKGEPLMEVETDKATVEVESPASGTLAAVTAKPGDDIAVGRAIAVILAAGESAASTPASAGTRGSDLAERPASAGTRGSDLAGISTSAGTRGAAAAQPGASPKARRLAAERGVDLARVRGSGPGGAVLEEDVLQAAGSAPQSEDSPLWRAMAENVSRSWREAPHFFVVREVDAEQLVAQHKHRADGVTYTDLLVKAVATALTQHPRMNSSQREVNVGLAVAVEGGLIVPVIHGADGMSVTEIALDRHELLERVRAGRVRASDLTGGTFTLSNLGMYGVDLFTAIVTEGQAGILAVGRLTDRVVARDGVPVVRPAMIVSLSCDHRRVDGARAAEFMQTLVGLLEQAPG